MYTLYYKPECPFCQKVLAFAEKHNITFDLKDINDEANAEELTAKGGRRQVPYLVDGEIAMYESDDIIAHLQSNQEEEN